MERIRTMSVAELTADLKACGIKTSQSAVRAMIIHGCYPFATGYRDPVSNKDGERVKFEIYTKLYEKWKKERSDDDAAL
jgi:hypothetical protein